MCKIVFRFGQHRRDPSPVPHPPDIRNATGTAQDDGAGVQRYYIPLFTCYLRANFYFGIFLAFSLVKTTIMKAILRLAVVLVALASFTYKPFYSLDAVTTAIRSGNVTLLSPYLDSRVDITLPDKSDTYSKTQAEMVIKDFLVTTGVQNFRITQKSENNNALYCTGILFTRNGNYRTCLFLKQKGGHDYIQEIRFQGME